MLVGANQEIELKGVPSIFDRPLPVTIGGVEHFGPYRFTRELGTVPIGPSREVKRFAALKDYDQSSHLVYRVHGLGAAKMGHRRFLKAVERCAALDHPHILPIEVYSLCSSGAACVVTPYPGDQAGLTTIASLMREKGGKLPANEVARALEHILAAVNHAHGKGFVHGAIAPERCLVDRFGRVILELYGLSEEWEPSVMERPDLARSEVKSIVHLACKLLTGNDWLPAGSPTRSNGGRMAAAMEAWVAYGLDPSRGFSSAGEALRALPTRDDGEAFFQHVKTSRVQKLLARVKGALG